MSRILVKIAVLCLILTQLNLFVAAETDFSCYDLSSCGLNSLQANPSTGIVTVDGAISPGEYVTKNTVTLGKGLHLLSLDGSGIVESIPEELLSLEENVFLSFDEDNLYFAIQFLFPGNAFSFTTDHPVFGACIEMDVFFSFNGEDNIASRSIGLTNRYFFSKDNLDCIGMTGLRRSATKIWSLTSLHPQEEKVRYTSCDGTVWSGERYRDATCLSITKLGEKERLILEGVIPMGEIWQTLSDDQQKKCQIAFVERAPFVGSFYSDLVLSLERIGSFASKGRFALSTSLDASMPCPVSPSGETWKECFCQASLDRIPSPVYWSGTVPVKKNENKAESRENEEIAKDKEINVQTSTVGKVSEKLPIQNATPPVSTLDFDDFLESIPAYSDSMPEHSEIIFEEGSADEKNADQGQSLFGSVAILVAGIALLGLIVFAGFVFHNMNKKTKTENKRTK